MKIGILGVGMIGKTLVQKLSAAGHDVKAANSRGPESIDPDVFARGGRGVTSAEAVKNVDVVIVSVNPRSFGQIAPLIKSLPSETVVIDTFNYYPAREGDGKIDALESGQVESVWASEVLGRPLVKAWNSIIFQSFATRGVPAGTPGRIALPVAGDNERDRRVAMALVEDTGFDAFDAGVLADSWRQQPGAPAYCTNLTLEELPGALAAAEKERLPKRRDIVWQAIGERTGNEMTSITEDYIIRLQRAVFM
jgi:8-hydroxy-5-deazaflavin:NADPH oxidoreductase